MIKQVAECLTYVTPGRRGVVHIPGPHYRIDTADETMLEIPEHHCDGGDITSSYLPGEWNKHQDRGEDPQTRKFGIP